MKTTPFLHEEVENSLMFDAYYATDRWTAYPLTSLVLSQRQPIKRYHTGSFTLHEMHRLAATQITREHFGYDHALTRLLSDLGFGLTEE